MLAADGLNEGQTAAILAAAGDSVLVHAGAGTGKTRVFTQRVAHLLELGVHPDDMLVCTFTRNAAEEIKARLPRHRDSLRNLGTIHSLALRGRPRHNYLGVSLVTDEEALVVLGSLRHLFPDARMDPRDVHLALSRMRENRAVRPEYLALLAAYRDALASTGRLDFLSLLEEGLTLKTSRRFRHILVDEVQDVTRLQADWLRTVAGPSAKFYCVGDENQAIYGFRGVTDEVVGPAASRFSLDLNYRCTPEILDYALKLLPPHGRLTPTLPHGRLVEVHPYVSEAAEMAAIQSAYERAPRKSEFMVLARTNAILAPFLTQGIPALTVHGAKGREWDQVWIAGMEQGNFPDVRGDPEEERRLAYVAVTRARKELTLSWAETREAGIRRKRLDPSIFLG
jgi:superfamily I DNA/RNA helicase